MKHSVVQSNMRERDIHPADLFSRFKEVSIADAKARFIDAKALVEVGCPACGAEERSPAFEKHGFQFNVCGSCQSVFVSPRPNERALFEYYRESDAIRFRADKLAKEAGERRAAVLRANALWLGRLVDEAEGCEARSYADFGTNYPTMFAQIESLGLFDKKYSVAPLPNLDEVCRDNGAEVAEGPLEQLGAATAFEQFEHQFAPENLLRSIYDSLSDGGMLFLTTRSVCGFDLQTLWDKNPHIYVPEHLNLLSIDGISRLLDRCGFEMIELSTPGQLDVELVRIAAGEDKSIRLPSFVSYMFEKRDRATREDFQTFLQKHRLSSHVRVAATKRERV